MPRRASIQRREVNPDPKFEGQARGQVHQHDDDGGKKSLAEGIFYGALDDHCRPHQEEPIDVFEQALDNVKPALEVKSRRVGGATYQVPVEVRPERRSLCDALAGARARAGEDDGGAAGAELIDAANEQRQRVKKRDETHKMAEANKAFAHYRW